MQDSRVVEIVHRCIDENARVLRIESDVGTLKSDVSTLKSDVHRHGIMLEEFRATLDKVLEIVLANQEKLEALASLNDRMDRHDDRLSALEDGHRRHLKNRRMHRYVTD